MTPMAIILTSISAAKKAKMKWSKPARTWHLVVSQRSSMHGWYIPKVMQFSRITIMDTRSKYVTKVKDKLALFVCVCRLSSLIIVDIVIDSNHYHHSSSSTSLSSSSTSSSWKRKATVYCSFGATEKCALLRIQHATRITCLTHTDRQQPPPPPKKKNHAHEEEETKIKTGGGEEEKKRSNYAMATREKESKHANKSPPPKKKKKQKKKDKRTNSHSIMPAIPQPFPRPPKCQSGKHLWTLLPFPSGRKITEAKNHNNVTIQSILLHSVFLALLWAQAFFLSTRRGA